MAVEARAKVELGDFQTPAALARRVCELLRRSGVAPESIVEPTCGVGSFLRASIETFPSSRVALGVDINQAHVDAARAGLSDDSVPNHGVTLRCEDFFSMDWPAALDGLPQPILVIGNPPWVTNSALGSLGGSNLPSKTNFQGLAGLDALTGKSNFDISEWMLLRLLEWLSGRRATLAMLCKTTVARKVLHHAWSHGVQLERSALYSFDAAQHFGAAVQACLLVCVLEPGAASSECAVFPDLDALERASTLAVHEGRLIADREAFDSLGHLAGPSPLRWRSGVKHDCARVMELRGGEGSYADGLGQSVALEETYLYPMLKSSEVSKPNALPTRWMLVPQRSIAEETTGIEREAPLTWAYLLSHASELDGRASSIYRNRPRFSVFGIGPYSFAPWKVAISGFYKRLDFRCIGPVNGKPVMLDDTSYFLPCNTREDAEVLARMLNSSRAQAFFRAFVFWDAKRPITARLLATLALGKLADECGEVLPTWSGEAETASLSVPGAVSAGSVPCRGSSQEKAGRWNQSS